MIFNDLVVTTKALQELQRKTQIKNNKEQQDNAEVKYRILLTQTNQLVEIISYLKKNSSFSVNKEVVSQLDSLLDEFEIAVSDGMVAADKITSLDNSLKVVQNNAKKDWPKQFSEIAGSTISTLEAIKGINTDGVDSCLEKINSAQTWELNIKNYQSMNEGIQDAKKIIAKLGLDDEIITFLANTNSGKATINDLSDKVLNWIKSEKLESKIRVSFVKISLN
jgi:hypothetical protein